MAKTREWVIKNKEYKSHYERFHKTKVKYGVTEEIYNKMLSEQNGVCKICSCKAEDAPKNKLFVDHCHSTGKVRGLLCDHCNNLLGRAKDSIKTLENAIKYLET